MPLDLTDDESTLVQVMAWCHQATSHYLSQCWLRFMVSLGLNELIVNCKGIIFFKTNHTVILGFMHSIGHKVQDFFLFWLSNNFFMGVLRTPMKWSWGSLLALQSLPAYCLFDVDFHGRKTDPVCKNRMSGLLTPTKSPAMKFPNFLLTFTWTHANFYWLFAAWKIW